MTKSQIVAAISDATDLSKRQADDALKALVDIIHASLKKGEEVSIPGFGKLKVKFRPQRKGRNPATGEELTIKASNAVSFSCAKPLKDAVKEAMPLKS
jgi:DNA-binding protein HU-beta